MALGLGDNLDKLLARAQPDRRTIELEKLKAAEDAQRQRENLERLRANQQPETKPKAMMLVPPPPGDRKAAAEWSAHVRARAQDALAGASAESTAVAARMSYRVVYRNDDWKDMSGHGAGGGVRGRLGKLGGVGLHSMGTAAAKQIKGAGSTASIAADAVAAAMLRGAAAGPKPVPKAVSELWQKSPGQYAGSKEDPMLGQYPKDHTDKTGSWEMRPLHPLARARAAQAAIERAMVKIGSVVQAKGLEGAEAGLNGLRGIVVNQDTDDNRWVVDFPPHEGQALGEKALKAANVFVPLDTQRRAAELRSPDMCRHVFGSENYSGRRCPLQEGCRFCHSDEEIKETLFIRFGPQVAARGLRPRPQEAPKKSFFDNTPEFEPSPMVAEAALRQATFSTAAASGRQVRMAGQLVSGLGDSYSTGDQDARGGGGGGGGGGDSGSFKKKFERHELKGPLTATWKCPGCGWHLRFVREWRCPRCLCLQPGAAPADEELLREQQDKIPALAMQIGVEEQELLAAHPEDLQVILQGGLDNTFMSDAALLSAMKRMLQILSWRCRDPELEREMNEYIAKSRLSPRIAMALRSLDSVGVREVFKRERENRERGDQFPILSLIVAEQKRCELQGPSSVDPQKAVAQGQRGEAVSKVIRPPWWMESEVKKRGGDVALRDWRARRGIRMDDPCIFRDDRDNRARGRGGGRDDEERDILHYMHSPPPSLTEETLLVDVLRRLQVPEEHGCKLLDAGIRSVGMVRKGSIEDLMKEAIPRHLAENIYGACAQDGWLAVAMTIWSRAVERTEVALPWEEEKGSKKKKEGEEEVNDGPEVVEAVLQMGLDGALDTYPQFRHYYEMVDDEWRGWLRENWRSGTEHLVSGVLQKCASKGAFPASAGSARDPFRPKDPFRRSRSRGRRSRSRGRRRSRSRGRGRSRSRGRGRSRSRGRRRSRSRSRRRGGSPPRRDGRERHGSVVPGHDRGRDRTPEEDPPDGYDWKQPEGGRDPREGEWDSNWIRRDGDRERDRDRREGDRERERDRDRRPPIPELAPGMVEPDAIRMNDLRTPELRKAAMKREAEREVMSRRAYEDRGRQIRDQQRRERGEKVEREEEKVEREPTPEEMEVEEVAVQLQRRDASASWGLMLSSNLRLKDTEKDSIAATNASIGRCIGMRLLRTNGISVRSMKDVSAVLGRGDQRGSAGTTLLMHFAPMDEDDEEEIAKQEGDDGMTIGVQTLYQHGKKGNTSFAYSFYNDGDTPLGSQKHATVGLFKDAKGNMFDQRGGNVPSGKQARTYTYVAKQRAEHEAFEQQQLYDEEQQTPLAEEVPRLLDNEGEGEPGQEGGAGGRTWTAAVAATASAAVAAITSVIPTGGAADPPPEEAPVEPPKEVKSPKKVVNWAQAMVAASKEKDGEAREAFTPEGGGAGEMHVSAPPVGTEVEIIGLQRAPELNGRRGRVQAPMRADGRVVVELVERDTHGPLHTGSQFQLPKAFFPTNIRVVGGDFTDAKQKRRLEGDPPMVARGGADDMQLERWEKDENLWPQDDHLPGKLRRFIAPRLGVGPPRDSRGYKNEFNDPNRHSVHDSLLTVLHDLGMTQFVAPLGKAGIVTEERMAEAFKNEAEVKRALPNVQALPLFARNRLMDWAKKWDPTVRIPRLGLAPGTTNEDPEPDPFASFSVLPQKKIRPAGNASAQPINPQGLGGPRNSVRAGKAGWKPHADASGRQTADNPQSLESGGDAPKVASLTWKGSGDVDPAPELRLDSNWDPRVYPDAYLGTECIIDSAAMHCKACDTTIDGRGPGGWQVLKGHVSGKRHARRMKDLRTAAEAKKMWATTEAKWKDAVKAGTAEAWTANFTCCFYKQGFCRHGESCVLAQHKDDPTLPCHFGKACKVVEHQQLAWAVEAGPAGVAGAAAPQQGGGRGGMAAVGGRGGKVPTAPAPPPPATEPFALSDPFAPGAWKSAAAAAKAAPRPAPAPAPAAPTGAAREVILRKGPSDPMGVTWAWDNAVAKGLVLKSVEPGAAGDRAGMRQYINWRLSSIGGQAVSTLDDVRAHAKGAEEMRLYIHPPAPAGGGGGAVKPVASAAWGAAAPAAAPKRPAAGGAAAPAAAAPGRVFTKTAPAPGPAKPAAKKGKVLMVKPVRFANAPGVAGALPGAVGAPAAGGGDEKRKRDEAAEPPPPPAGVAPPVPDDADGQKPKKGKR